MKIFATSFNSITPIKIQRKLNFGNNSLENVPQNDCFQGSELENEPRTKFKKSNFILSFSESMTRIHKKHSATNVVNTIRKYLIETEKQEDNNNPNFENIIKKFGLSLEESGFESYEDENYKKYLEEKILNSGLVDFVNSTSYLPINNLKETLNISLKAKLCLADYFISKNDDISMLNDLKTHKKIKSILKAICELNPKTNRTYDITGYQCANYLYNDSIMRIVFDKVGQIKVIKLESTTDKKTSKIETSQNRKRLDNIHKNSICNLENALIDKKRELNPSYIIADIMRYLEGKPGSYYKEFVQNHHLTPQDFGNFSSDSKYYQTQVKKELEKIITPFMEQINCYIPVFKDGKTPNISVHASFRLLERFILDKNPSLDSICSSGNLTYAGRIIGRLYTQEPDKIEKDEDGDLVASYTIKKDIVKAVFSPDGELKTIFKKPNKKA